MLISLPKKSVLKKLKRDKELLKKLAGSHWRRIHRKIVFAKTLKSFKG